MFTIWRTPETAEAPRSAKLVSIVSPVRYKVDVDVNVVSA